MEKKELELFKAQNYLFERLDGLGHPGTHLFQAKLAEVRATPIYKFMSLEHTKLMIQNKTLWVGKVSAWDDVYENILFKQRFFHDLGAGAGLVRIDVNTVGNNIFGQCWTSRAESDAMWRIYSPDKSSYAVRVKTTIGKLMDAAFVGPEGIPTTFVGEVSYVDNAEISRILAQYAKDGIHFSSSMQEYANLLLLKRKEFEHEKEIRLIVAQDSDYNMDHIELAIDPQQFIDEITLDSRMAPGMADYNHYRAELLLAGISSGKVNRSTLYDLPAPVDITIH